MVKFLVITDGGDGDISHQVVDTPNQAQSAWSEAEENNGYVAYAGIFEIDFDAQTIKRTQFCQ